MKFVCVACGACVDVEREVLGECPTCSGDRWEHGGTYDRPIDYGRPLHPSRSGYGPTIESGYGRRK